jgi:F0F1-type ATP synthase membrane subunit b/b'
MRWDDSVLVPDEPAFEDASPIPEKQAAGYLPVPSWCMGKGALKKLSGEFVDYLYAKTKMILFSNPHFKVVSDFGEESDAFIARVTRLAEDEADKEVEKLTTDLKKKVEALQKKIKQEERQHSLYEMEHEERRRDELLSAGETIVGLVFGSKKSTGLSKASTKRRMTKRYKMKVEESEDVLADLREELKALVESAEEKVLSITEEKRAQAQVIEEMEVKLEKNDIYMKDFGILWIPV